MRSPRPNTANTTAIQQWQMKENHAHSQCPPFDWIPACAGMTVVGAGMTTVDFYIGIRVMVALFSFFLR